MNWTAAATSSPLSEEELEKYREFVAENDQLQMCLVNHRALIIAGLSGIGDTETLTTYQDWLSDSTLKEVFERHWEEILAVLTLESQ